MSYETLLKEVRKDDPTPCWRLEEDICYQYNSNGDLFSKTFMFRILEDRHEDYLITVEEQFETPLLKTYELINAINDGAIIKLGTREELGLDFDMKEYLDGIENIEDYLEKEKDDDEK